MKISKIIYLTISLLLALCCFLVVQSLMQDKKPGPPLEITIADVKAQSFGLLYIAEAEGYFANENLKVNFRTFNMTTDSLNDVIAGSSDLAAVSEIPFIRKINYGEDLSVISSLHKSKNNSAVIGMKKNGIYTVPDLKGKKIAVMKGTDSEFLLYALLKSYNIKISEVKLIFTDSNNIEKQFRDGTVDAVSVANSNLFSIQESYNAQEISLFFPNSYIANTLLVGKSENIKENKEAYMRLMRALAKAEDYYHNNPTNSMKIVASKLPNANKETLEKLWKVNELSLVLDNVLIEILNSQYQTMQDLGQANPHKVNFRDIIYVDYLKEAKPEDITVF